MFHRSYLKERLPRATPYPSNCWQEASRNNSNPVAVAVRQYDDCILVLELIPGIINCALSGLRGSNTINP